MTTDNERDPVDLAGPCLCESCRHYLGEDRCAAFPQGIPLVILSNQMEHCHPFPGDRGIMFEPRE